MYLNNHNRRLACVLTLLLLAALAPRPATAAGGRADAPAEGDRYGTIALWEISGITGGAEGYENQLAFALTPSAPLGRLLRLPALLRPLRVGAELLMQVELAGNDPSFRGGQFASPALLQDGGPQLVATSETGAFVDAQTGQVEGAGRRLLLSDLWLAATAPDLVRLPWVGVELGAALALTFPTSAPSQAAGFITSVGLGLTLSRTLWSRLTLSYELRHAQYIYQHATADGVALEGDAVINGRSEPLYQPQRSTVLNPSFAFINEFSAEVEIGWGLSAAASYALVNTFTYALPAPDPSGLPALADPCADGRAVAAATGAAVVACGDRTQRDSGRFSLELSYQALPQLSLSLALSTIQPLRHEGAQISNPFVQALPRAGYTTLQLGITAHLEPTYAAVRRLVRGRGGDGPAAGPANVSNKGKTR